MPNNLPAEPTSRERARKAIGEQLVVKANDKGEYFVSLLDPHGNHLFSAPSWGWGEGTVQHRNEMVERIAEIFAPVLDAAKLEALEKAAQVAETYCYDRAFEPDHLSSAIRKLKGEA